MATFNERIQVVIDVVTEKATKGFGDFRKAVSEAEGFTGKLKAGVSSLGGAFIGAATSPAGLAAAVGVAAKVASDAVQQYSDLGIAVDNFATATGLSLDAASRLYEVTGDLGGSTDALQTALNKMNKATDPKVFADLGIAMAKTNTGAQDVAGTFLNVIDHLNAIKDPTERAKQGTLLFGKAWTSLAPLIAAGADKIRKNMQDVADVKVFDKDKVAQTRKFQEAQAALNDSIQELSLTLGQELVPALTNTIGPIAKLVGSFQSLKDAMGTAGMSGLEMLNQASEWIGGWFSDAAPQIEYTGQAITKMGDAAGGSARYLGLLAQHTRDAADRSKDLTSGLTTAKVSLKNLQDQISGRKSFIDLQNQLKDNAEKIKELETGYKTGKVTAEDYYLGVASAALDSQGAVADFVSELDGISDDKKLELVATLDPASPGTIVNELQTALTDAQFQIKVYSDLETRRGTTGGMGPGNVTINVAVPHGANQYEIGKTTHDALQAYYRNGGPR